MKFFQLFSNKEPSDEELIKKYQQNNATQYAGELFQRYTHLIFGVCMKYLQNEDDAKDAVMSIFEKLLNDLSKYEQDNFKGWLYVLSKNYCLMQLRKKQSKVNKEAQVQHEFMESSQAAHSNVDDDEEQLEVNLEKLGEAINKLKDEQRICIELFYLKGKSYNDIVNHTGLDYKSVKSHIQNGKRNLKNLMQS
jgi:RNA polymerase sigma-70 factor (ECF subfamily)